MQSEPIWRYIWIGTALRFMQDQQEGWRVHGPNLLLSNLADFRESLDRYGFVVTARAFDYQVAAIRDRLAAEEAAYILSKADSEDLSNAARSLMRTMEAEGMGKVAFVVAERRYDSDRLLTRVDSLLPTGVYGELHDLAKHDFGEAGRAIAFELPTAAAFHVLRATEQVLRDMYRDWVRQRRVAPLLWGSMTNDMRSRTRRPPDALLNHLDHIRLTFRNPTDHPEKTYDIEEAQDLFALCCDAVGQMVRTRRT